MVLTTVAVVPLAFSTWTIDVFNLTALTVLWLGTTIGAAAAPAVVAMNFRRVSLFEDGEGFFGSMTIECMQSGFAW